MKAIWINPLSTGSTSLDVKINPHDVDPLALTRILQKQGFDVWLQEPFMFKKYLSSWDKIVITEDLPSFDADVAIMSCNPFLMDYVGHKYEQEKDWRSRAKRLDIVARWLDNFKGDLYLAIFDPRPSFQKMFFAKKGDHPIRKHIERAKLLVGDIDFLVPELKDRGVTCEYWKAVKVGDPLPFNQENDYFCVYPGLKFQNGTRKKMVTNWLDRDCCYTAGELKLPEIPSLTNYKSIPLSEVLDITHRSTTSLVCGEKTHTWLTPRVIQSLVCGTICSIHPEFAGSHHLPSDMVSEQTVAKASEFDVELSERVYQRQVNFAMSLYNGNAKSGVE